MNIYNIRQTLKEKSIFEHELRVCYYARVSSEKEEQKSSIINQKGYYEDYIAKFPKWKFVGAYVDEGISGISTRKRESFQRMMSDAQCGKIDLILTKEISRFARNTLDSIQYTRDLLTFGTAVWFQSDNINTLDEDSELRLTIMAGIAQDEIRKLSTRVKFGHARSIKNGIVMGNSMIYGYTKEKGKLVINEEEAEMVRLIFNKYATGRWTTPKIEELLWERGYRNHKGEKINRGVIGHIITNPKYKGYYAGGKVKIVDIFTKTQEFLPEEEWTMYKDDGTRVPAIVSEEIWEQANKFFKSRGNDIRKRRSSYKYENIFTGKIICGIDGSKYWLKTHVRRNGRKYNTWVCSHRINNGADSCESKPLKEENLVKIIAEIFNRLADNKNKIIDDYFKLLNEETSSLPNVKQLIYNIEQDISALKKKREKILEYNLAGHISDEEFIARNKTFTDKIADKEDELKKLTSSKVDENELKKDMKKMLLKISEYSNIEHSDINKQIVEETVDRIIIMPEKENVSEIKVYLKNEQSFLFQSVSGQSEGIIMDESGEPLSFNDSEGRSDNILLTI